MGRNLTEIYNEAKLTRDKFLSLTEFRNSSKLSVLDAFTWVVAACIWSFENILDVFKFDINLILQNRINGTPAYYSKMLLEYQSGDQLAVDESGIRFYYPNVDESKRIITRVSYSEYNIEGYLDKGLLLKVASGSPGGYKKIEREEILKVQEYINQIKFAGTFVSVVSREGDILIPKLTVYHDGTLSDDELYTNIESALNDFIANVEFNAVVYSQKIIDAIQAVEHVIDVYVGSDQGIYVAQYNDDGNLVEVEGNAQIKVERFFVPNSGYIKQSTATGEEADLPLWKDSITLQIENLNE